MADDEPAADEVSVLTADGDVVTGRLQSLGDALTIVGKEEQPRQFKRNEVHRIRRTGADSLAAEPAALALLGNGDTLVGRPVRVADDLFSLEWEATIPPTTLEVPLEFVRAIVFNQPPEQAERQHLQRQWGLPRSGTDRLLLTNATTIDGELNGIDGGNVVLETGLGLVTTPRDDVGALTLNAELAARMPLSMESSVLLSADGSRLTLQEASVDAAGILSGKAVFGGEISLPLEQVTCLQLFSDRVQPLAGREPQEYVFTPFLTGEHPLVTNRNVLGGPLRVRGVRFATGLGVHSRSEVTYDLGEEGWTSFTATIGIDDMAGGLGHAVFRVAVDGETVYDSGDVSGSAEPIVVGPVALSDARRLTLIVDFGRSGNIRDIANWCDPLLSR